MEAFQLGGLAGKEVVILRHVAHYLFSARLGQVDSVALGDTAEAMSQENVEIVQELFGAVSRGGIEGALRLREAAGLSK